MSNIIKKLHIDLENATVGVEFKRGDVVARHTIHFESLPNINELSVAVQKQLDADVAEVSDGTPQKLTSHLHRARTSREEHAQLQRSIKLDSAKLGKVRKEIELAEAKRHKTRAS